MPLAVDLLLSRTLGLFKLLRKVLANYIIKSIVYSRDIANNYANILYNIVIVKNRKESVPLMLATMAFYYIKSK